MGREDGGRRRASGGRGGGLGRALVRAADPFLLWTVFAAGRRRRRRELPGLGDPVEGPGPAGHSAPARAGRLAAGALLLAAAVGVGGGWVGYAWGHEAGESDSAELAEDLCEAHAVASVEDLARGGEDLGASVTSLIGRAEAEECRAELGLRADEPRSGQGLPRSPLRPTQQP